MSAHASNAYPLGPDGREQETWVSTLAGSLAQSTHIPSGAPLRVAAIDIDGITARLLVADVGRDRAGHLTASPLRRRAAVTALEARPPHGERFDQMAIARTIDVIAHFHQLAAASGARTTLVKVPALLQSAPEWQTMRFEAEQRLGSTLNIAEPGTVASGWNVADLIAYASPDVGWLIDGGSHSADIVLSAGFEPVAHHRLTSGFLRVLEEMLEAHDPPEPRDIIRAYNELSESLSRRFTPSGAGGAIVGVACDLTGLGEWLGTMPHVDGDPSTTAISLDHVARKAIAQSKLLRAERHFDGATLDTTGSTLASLVILETAMRHFELDVVVTRRQDVLDQLAVQAAGMLTGERPVLPGARPALALVPQLPDIETTSFAPPPAPHQQYQPEPHYQPPAQQTVQLAVAAPAQQPVQVVHPAPAAVLAPVQQPVPVEIPVQAPVPPAATPAPVAKPGIGRRLFKMIARLIAFSVIAVLALITTLTWGTHVTKYRTYVILGKSMEPTIALGAVIVGEPVDRNKIKKGDVITYSRPDKPGERVTHRVIQVKERDGRKVFKTKGDNNTSIDPWIADYVGKTAWRVKYDIPYVGWVLMALQSKMGRVVVIILPAIFLFGMFVRWLWTDDGQDDTAPPPSAPVAAGPA